ncbi:MAG: formate dehydrogenase accessory sulfurtransferase FdhD [Proteobacteria bacterium]|nr:formate dehydrogenase accessory sulfurtransferase FdhD [Verrucomicrobiota bacterium]NBU08052.1 formate dehydrogenase accessory sulfurtransferase FdhD [Pseudomonadota bacterium]
MPSSPEIVCAEILRWRRGEEPRREQDALAREEPLEIRVRGQSVAVTMRTPGRDAELAAGFLLTEGLVTCRGDIVEIAHCQQGEAAQLGNTLNVFLAPSVVVDFEQLTRHVFASSSCGLCGKATIESVHQQFPPVTSSVRIAPEILLQLPARLAARQATFDQTGGLHAAALFTATGELLVLREDVGRHNAVDKVLGWAFLNGSYPPADHILLVSGRASFEIMQKALAARVPVVAAVSAPSSLAVEFAQRSGQTLVGFLRGAGMNIYAGEERVGLAGG